MSSLRQWALGLPAQGRFTFTTTEVRPVQARVSAARTAAALGWVQFLGLVEHRAESVFGFVAIGAITPGRS